jgi:hypothetical protein
MAAVRAPAPQQEAEKKKAEKKKAKKKKAKKLVCLDVVDHRHADSIDADLACFNNASVKVQLLRLLGADATTSPAWMQQLLKELITKTAADAEPLLVGAANWSRACQLQFVSKELRQLIDRHKYVTVEFYNCVAALFQGGYLAAAQVKQMAADTSRELLTQLIPLQTTETVKELNARRRQLEDGVSELLQLQSNDPYNIALAIVRAGLVVKADFAFVAAAPSTYSSMKTQSTAAVCGLAEAALGAAEQLRIEAEAASVRLSADTIARLLGDVQQAVDNVRHFLTLHQQKELGNLFIYR